MGKRFSRATGLFLAWCFAAMAAASVWMAYVVLRVPVYSSRDAAEPSMSSKLGVIGAPVLLGSVFALAWWTVLRRKRSAWKWGLAASFMTGGMGSLLCFGPAARLPVAGWPMLGLGAAGVLVFALTINGRKHSANKTTLRALPRASKAISYLIAAAGGVAMVVASQLWTAWAKARGLPDGPPFPAFLLLLIPVILAVLVIHEAGHALAGLAVRMKLIIISFGPLVWWNDRGKWKFRFHAAGLKSVRAFVAMVPVEMAGFRRRKIMLVTAGPGANIITGIAATALLLALPQVAWGERWAIVATFATASLMVGAMNLAPFAIGAGGYSDGAKLYQLLSGGFWTDYHRMLGMIYSSGVTHARPRDYPIETIHGAIDSVAKGNEALFLRLSAYSYFLDRGESSLAAEEIAKAEQFCKESGLEVPPEWSSIFVFAYALLCRDPVAARAWWEKLECKTKKKTEPGDHWTSLAALLWSENRMQEAGEALEKAEAWVRQFAASGFVEAERNAIRLVREALDKSAASEAAAIPEPNPGEMAHISQGNGITGLP